MPQLVDKLAFVAERAQRDRQRCTEPGDQQPAADDLQDIARRIDLAERDEQDAEAGEGDRRTAEF